MKRFLRLALAFLLLLAALMECAQALLRYFFHLPIMWLDEAIVFPAIWLYMLGFANASLERAQITAKILPALFPGPRAVAACDLCASFFSALISSWLTFHALDYFFYSIGANRQTASLFLPLCIGEAAIAAGLLLATACALIDFCHDCRGLLRIFLKGRPPC